MAQSYSGREWGCILGVQNTTAPIGTDTADALQTYLESWANTSEQTFYLDWGYNYVETPNYITLAFYESIS